VIERRDINMVFQPVVDLATGLPVAYEALARGPAGTELERPDQLFAAAAAANCVGELDLLCRAQAFMQADATDYRHRFALFVNGELGVASRTDDELGPFLSRTAKRGKIVLELAERSIFVQPATLLQTVADARKQGWGIAIDDIGKTNDSLGLMGLTDPDVLKLDLSIVQSRPSRRTGLTLNAIAHKVESTGATVIAEGIETDAHLARAVSLGAHFGQGWFFGRPEPLPRKSPDFGSWDPMLHHSDRRDHSSDGSSFELVEHNHRLRRATKDVLYAVSLDLEHQAASQPDGAVIFACFQRGMFVPERTRTRYQELADQCSLVVALGEGLTSNHIPGVRCIALADNDPLADEWTVIVQSSHFSAALIARDCGDDGPDESRRFDYCITYDRQVIQRASQSLLSRVGSDTTPN